MCNLEYNIYIAQGAQSAEMPACAGTANRRNAPDKHPAQIFV